MTGRIRSSASAPWMPFAAEQHSFFDPPRRYFWMKATRGGLLIDGLHVYGETDAHMRIRLLSLVPVIDLSGPEMMRTETVTIFVDFWSDDRPALAEDGKTLLPQRWSTPVRDYRAMGHYRLASRGEGRYAPASGEYTYIEFDGIEIIAEPAPHRE